MLALRTLEINQDADYLDFSTTIRDPLSASLLIPELRRLSGVPNSLHTIQLGFRFTDTEYGLLAFFGWLEKLDDEPFWEGFSELSTVYIEIFPERRGTSFSRLRIGWNRRDHAVESEMCKSFRKLNNSGVEIRCIVYV